MAHEVKSGEIDPLELELAPSYQELQKAVAELDSKLSLDESLNEILVSKVTRIQEIARILQAPEFYVRRMSKLRPRELAKLIEFHSPITISHIELKPLQRALERMILFKENLTREPPEEEPPPVSEIDEDFVFTSEDSIFQEDLIRFTETIPLNTDISIDDLTADVEFDIFLKKFLYVVVLISKGTLTFDTLTRSVRRVE
jgi:hypothetical protein